MSLFKTLFGAFPNSDSVHGQGMNKKQQKPLGESIIGSVFSDMRKTASDIEQQIKRRGK